ncbi:MAG: sugar isomerase domain-containing protein [Armatimonadota bacterium]|nr:sugar isomerase domain-containing protein [Armatimonadota bacterium]
MLAKSYIQTLHSLLDRIADEQMANIRRAGEMIADTWASGGAVFITDMGHGVASELTGRAGGLMALRRFGFSMHLDNPIADCQRNRPRNEPIEVDLEQIRTAVRTSQLRPGDLVLVGSVSGRNKWPIEVAMECRRLGVKVIVLTSLEYTSQVNSLHPSGKKLSDVGDLVIDICAPYGDASQEVDGLPVKVLPVSGIGFIAILWMICGEAIEKMLEKGLRPHVYMSNNRDGGPEFNERELAEYNKVGY